MASPLVDEILETMTLLQDWEDRYAYIIDLGKKLPPYPPEFVTDALLVPGCTARVWMHHSWDNGQLRLDLDSDALIVKGLLHILYAFYNGKTAAAIINADVSVYFTKLNMDSHLSPNRRSGFFAVASRIKNLAELQ